MAITGAKACRTRRRHDKEGALEKRTIAAWAKARPNDLKAENLQLSIKEASYFNIDSVAIATPLYALWIVEACGVVWTAKETGSVAQAMNSRICSVVHLPRPDVISECPQPTKYMNNSCESAMRWVNMRAARPPVITAMKNA